MFNKIKENLMIIAIVLIVVLGVFYGAWIAQEENTPLSAGNYTACLEKCVNESGESNNCDERCDTIFTPKDGLD